jgi:uncharacterized OsmC-like protein
MEKTLKATGSWQGGFRVDLQAGNHKIIIDQPQSGGGNDEGPNSLDALLFSLGGCLGTMAVIIAKQERINLRGFDMEIEGDYDSDNLMGKTTEGRAGFTEIRVNVNIDADLTDEEKQEFFHKVDSRCPTSDNLMNVTPIVFSLK